MIEEETVVPTEHGRAEQEREERKRLYKDVPKVIQIAISDAQNGDDRFTREWILLDNGSLYTGYFETHMEHHSKRWTRITLPKECYLTDDFPSELTNPPLSESS